MKRGDICWYTFQKPNKRRPVLILTRDSAIAVLNAVSVAPLSSTIRGIPTEVILTEDDGLPGTCTTNVDNIQTIPKSNLSAPIAQLSAVRMQAIAQAIGFALGLPNS